MNFYGFVAVTLFYCRCRNRACHPRGGIAERRATRVDENDKKLEKEIGFPLFERKGRGITLSKCGKYLYDYVAEAVKVIERAPGVVARFASDIKDVVKLNVLAASDCVTTAIIDYKKSHACDVVFPSCRTTRFPMRILRYIPTQKGQTARTSLIFAKILCLPSPKRRIIRA